MLRTAPLILSLSWLLTSVADGQTIDVMPVWSGHPVGFALLTHEDRQFVAFYDADRQMTVGVRTLDSHKWNFVRLPQKLGWDSHNYVTLALDRNACLHLSGNMHAKPLVYFRTSKPLDITTFEQIPQMLGQREQRCTYPQFFQGPSGELIFTYRDGSSGNGDQLYNVFNPASRTWRRLIDGSLISGEGKTNAYIQGPRRGPDGVYHMCWCWRDTGDCATNHDLSYARSRDLIHWAKSDGTALSLPITIRTAEIVDPVPAKGGLLNSNIQLSFDRQGRPILSYHKYDAKGALQCYNARLERDGTSQTGTQWHIERASDWTWRYEFSGGGSIGARVHVYPVEVTPKGLRQHYVNAYHGSGAWLLDETTLRPIPAPAATSAGADSKKLQKSASGTPPMNPTTQPVLTLRAAADLGRGPNPAVSYRLEWQTLPANRDRPREGPPPPPAMLKLVAVSK